MNRTHCYYTNITQNAVIKAKRNLHRVIANCYYLYTFPMQMEQALFPH
jgi:hypothetical protein